MEITITLSSNIHLKCKTYLTYEVSYGLAFISTAFYRIASYFFSYRRCEAYGNYGYQHVVI